MKDKRTTSEAMALIGGMKTVCGDDSRGLPYCPPRGPERHWFAKALPDVVDLSSTQHPSPCRRGRFRRLAFIVAFAIQLSFSWAEISWTLVNAALPIVCQEDSATLFIADGETLYLIGGRINLAFPWAYSDDVYASTDGGETWSVRNSAPGWEPRTSMTGCAWNGKLYAMHGYFWDYVSGDTTVYQDVWRSADEGRTWVKILAATSFDSVMHWHLAPLGSKLYLWGGQKRLDPVYVAQCYSTPDGVTWTLETSSPGWSAHDIAAGCVFNGYLWNLGGSYGSTRYNDVWRSSNGATWTKVIDTPSYPYPNSSENLCGAAGNVRMYVSKPYLKNGTETGSILGSADGTTWTPATADQAEFTTEFSYETGLVQNGERLYYRSKRSLWRGTNTTTAPWRLSTIDTVETADATTTRTSHLSIVKHSDGGWRLSAIRVPED